MSIKEVHSLIDLTQQFPFDIDEEVKKQICFSEAVIISCGHFDDAVDDSYSDLDWTCESSESVGSGDVPVPKATEPFEVSDKTEEEDVAAQSDEENDFYVYFFPDCTKPTEKRSSESVILVDGVPKINKKNDSKVCFCTPDKLGECPCMLNTPCKCGAKTLHNCNCGDLKNICICDETNPARVCTCAKADICLCKDHKPRPKCDCEKEVKRPCICDKSRFPLLKCECLRKPTSVLKKKTTIEPISEVDEFNEEGEGELSEASSENKNENEELSLTDTETIPCDCQTVPKETCLCVVKEKCTCNKDTCICGIRHTCICRATDSNAEIPCKGPDSLSICSCSKPVCTCTEDNCVCIPKPKSCECDPDTCICQKTCDCTLPCTCDTKPKKEEPECLCDDPALLISKGIEPCTCKQKDKSANKLKRVRAGKEGYRWCHEVDPHHTFFDYAYGRHDKISNQEKLIPKVEILGLHDEKQETTTSADTRPTEPPLYKRNAQKKSLDCCSTVGGMSISVETLGDYKNRFLVQVVSHSSKNGAKTGTKLVSIVDSFLHTLEENRNEHISRQENTMERRSYMAICENGYYNKVTCKCNSNTIVKRYYHTFQQAKNFLLEGANVLLMRYLGISRYRGVIKTDTVLMNGHICESIYVSKGVSQAVVNGTPMFVVKVERHIIEPNGRLHQTLTVVTLKGYMVSHEWADNNYVIHINPLLNVNSEKDEIEDHAPLRETWRNDLQLFSDFLDRKSARTSEGGLYCRENGELMGTIKDYLQMLLMLKPSDVLHFTQHYFGSVYSALDLPHNDFFEPSGKHVRYYFFEE